MSFVRHVMDMIARAKCKRALQTIIVLSLVQYLLFSTVFAQGIVSEDNTWNVFVTGYPGYIGTESYKIEGDSVQNGFEYKIIWLTNDSVDVSWSYQGLMREDSNVVYFVPPGGTEGILYNFNLDIGDTSYIKNMFCGDEEVPVSITDIDTVEYFGVDRKRWFLYTEFDFFDFWIEGIGGSLGPLHTAYYRCIACPTWDLLCFHSNDTLLFQREGFDVCYVTNVGLEETDLAKGILLFPNPVHDKFKIWSELNFGVELLEIFDLTGKRLIEEHFPRGKKNVEVDASTLNPGMYICRIQINGRLVTRKLIKR